MGAFPLIYVQTVDAVQLCDLIGSKPHHVLSGGGLNEVDNFCSFDNCISLGYRISGELSSTLQKARVKSSDLSP